jgi:uncharacterized protein YjiS (DUF1127 family)
MQNTITAAQTSASSGIPPPAKMLGQQLATAWSQYMTWRARRATKLLLKSLDDRTLADIGVVRTGIDTVVRDLEQQRVRW